MLIVILDPMIFRPQAVMATGQVLFHRFYCKKSFARFDVKVSFLFFSCSVLICWPALVLLSAMKLFLDLILLMFSQRVAASCVWLASKLEESPRKARQVLIVFHRMECRRENLPIEHLDLFSKVHMSCMNLFSGIWLYFSLFTFIALFSTFAMT